MFFFMKGIKMKKILKYSTILGTALMLSAPVALADTGGYVRIKGFDSHFIHWDLINLVVYSGPDQLQMDRAGECRLQMK